MTTLRPISFQLEITQRRWCSYTKTKKMIEFKTDRWHHTHMIQLSRKEFRQLVKKQVEASLGKKLRLWDHRVLNQAERSARKAMHEVYKDIKKFNVEYILPDRYQRSKDQDIDNLVSVNIRDEQGLLSCTKDNLRNKLKDAVTTSLNNGFINSHTPLKDNYGRRNGVLIGGGSNKAHKKKIKSEVNIIVSKKLVDDVFKRIRMQELASAENTGPNRRLWETPDNNIRRRFISNI